MLGLSLLNSHKLHAPTWSFRVVLKKACDSSPSDAAMGRMYMGICTRIYLWAHYVIQASKKVCTITFLVWLQDEYITYQYLSVIIPGKSRISKLLHYEVPGQLNLSHSSIQMNWLFF